MPRKMLQLLTLCLLSPQSSRCIKLLIPSMCSTEYLVMMGNNLCWQQRMVPAEWKHLPADASNSSCSILRFTSSHSKALPESIQHAAGRPCASVEEPLSRETSGHKYEKVFIPLEPTKIKVRALWGRKQSLSSVSDVHEPFAGEGKQWEMLLSRMGEAEAQSSNNALEIKKSRPAISSFRRWGTQACTEEKDLY